jgi:hypothetical protein
MLGDEMQVEEFASRLDLHWVVRLANGSRVSRLESFSKSGAPVRHLDWPREGDSRQPMSGSGAL